MQLHLRAAVANLGIDRQVKADNCVSHRCRWKDVELELVFDVSRRKELGDNVRSPEFSVLINSAAEAEADVGRASPDILRKMARLRGEHGVVVVIQVAPELNKGRAREVGGGQRSRFNIGGNNTVLFETRRRKHLSS